VKIIILFNGLSMDYLWTIYGLSMEGFRYVLKAIKLGCLYYYLESFQNTYASFGDGIIKFRAAIRFGLWLRS